MLTHHKARLRTAQIHYVTAGEPDAEPLLLVHGFPCSWYEWRHVIARLAPSWRIIAPDLRGSGDSSKPIEGYDKKTMAGDLAELLDHLRYGKVHVVGRDWGAPTAFALALHWERAKSLTFIENLVPGFGFEEAVKNVHHVAFHMIPDMPEFLIQGREREYFTWFFLRLAYNTGAFDKSCIEEYVRCLSQPGALRATLGYTRAYLRDGEDNRAAIAAKGKLNIPVLALGAEHSTGAHTGASIAHVAERFETDVIPACGHWATEEQPEWLAERISTFLGKYR